MSNTYKPYNANDLEFHYLKNDIQFLRFKGQQTDQLIWESLAKTKFLFNPEYPENGGDNYTAYMESKEYLEDLIDEKTVYIDVCSQKPTDFLDRYICMVYTDYNETHYLNVNKAMLVSGHAEAKNLLCYMFGDLAKCSETPINQKAYRVEYNVQAASKYLID